MNQINTNVIRENFYAAVSTAKSNLGNVVNAVRANPNAVIATVAVIATAILLRAAVKGYKNYTELKNQVKSQNAENTELLDQKISITKKFLETEKKLNNINEDVLRLTQHIVKFDDVKKDVKSLTKLLETKNTEIGNLKTALTFAQLDLEAARSTK